MSHEPSREPSEATIPLEAKQTKRSGRPRKQRKPSDKAMAKENMEVIASPRYRAEQEHVARKDNILVQA